MKRVLFVYHASNIGGGTYCLLNILKEIDRQRFQPIVLLRADGDLVKEIDSLGIEVLFMSSMTLIPYNKSFLYRETVLSYVNIRRSLQDFEIILRRVSPDAVYFNTMMLAPYLEVAKIKGYKTIIHLREHWPLDEHKRQLSRVQNLISTYADKIVAINRYSASMIPNRDATIVYDWIDLSNRYEYRPFDEIFKEDTSHLKVYLFTGGLQDIKGAAEVVDVFVNRITDKDRRLLMVGVNEHPDYRGLKNKVRYFLSKFGIDVYEYKVRKMIASDSRIVCIPAKYELVHIMEQAYCNLSFFTIPHANLALAESIIVGTIPVAARTDESMEYSNGGQLAVLFDLGCKDDMFSKLLELDSKHDSMKKDVEINGHYVAELFDKKRNSAVLNQVLNELLEN